MAATTIILQPDNEPCCDAIQKKSKQRRCRSCPLFSLCGSTLRLTLMERPFCVRVDQSLKKTAGHVVNLYFQHSSCKRTMSCSVTLLYYCIMKASFMGMLECSITSLQLCVDLGQMGVNSPGGYKLSLILRICKGFGCHATIPNWSQCISS